MNPLAIASGLLESYQDELKRTGVKSGEALERKLGKLENALLRLDDCIAGHRARLVEIQETK